MTNKSEQEFLQTLERRAEEEKKLSGSEILPRWAVGIGEWLVVNPWRALVPAAIIVYCVCRVLLGAGFRDVILGIFGGFR